MNYEIIEKTAPTTEPITLTQVKAHLRFSSQSLADSITVVQSIAPGAHVIASAYSLVGAAVEVLGYGAMVNLISGTNQANGTVDCKIQESDDNITYTDWIGGAFVQITTANDNDTYEIEYTGSKQYIKTVATVAVATCDFSTQVVKVANTPAEDDYLNNLIKGVREVTEKYLNRALITQTLNIYFDEFPANNYITIPRPNLRTVESIIYTDENDIDATFDSSNYLVDTIHKPGRIYLKSAASWPSFTPRPFMPVNIEITCGYGAAADVPEPIKTAMYLMIADLFQNRETIIDGTVNFLPSIETMLCNYKVWS